MNTLRQHTPTFVDHFETTADLLNLDIVRQYAERHDFSHFALSEELLMAILGNGDRWFVIGYIADPAAVDLPHWEE